MSSGFQVSSQLSSAKLNQYIDNLVELQVLRLTVVVLVVNGAYMHDKLHLLDRNSARGDLERRRRSSIGQG